MAKISYLFTLSLLFLAACADGRFLVIELPDRQAELYPKAHTNNEVTVAVDEVDDRERAWKYFGADLVGSDITPVIIIISNHSKSQLLVNPANILLRRGSSVIDPIPVVVVSNFVKRDYGFMSDDTETKIDQYFSDISFSEAVVEPGENYQGVMFFKLEKPRNSDSYFQTISLYSQRLKLNMIIPERDSNQRLRFGPYALSY